MPSQTQRLAAKYSFDSRAIRRSKYIAKSRRRIPAIVKRSYGKSIVVKLAQVTTADITALTDFDTVYGIYSLISASNDFSNFKNSYALMNCIHVTLKIYPQAWQFSSGIDRVAGFCYSVKDNAVIGSIKSICDHEQHRVCNFASKENCFIFSVPLKATTSMPVSTSSVAENWGYIKGFADNADFGSAGVSIAKLEFIVTVCFSSEA